MSQPVWIQETVLTQYVQGVKYPEHVLPYALPITRTVKAGQIPRHDPIGMQDIDTERASGADSNEVESVNQELDGFYLPEHDAVDKGDTAEMNANSKTGIAERMIKSENAKGIVINQFEKGRANLLQDLSNSYLPAHVLTLSGTDQFSHDDSDPETSVLDAASMIRKAVFRKPNVAIIGLDLFKRLKAHPKIKAAIPTGTVKKVTLELLKELFEVDYIGVSETSLQDPKTKATTALWGNHLGLYYVNNTAIKEAPTDQRNRLSYGYTFMERGSGVVDSYTTSGGKVTKIRYTDRGLPVITCIEAGAIITDVL